MPRLNPYSSNDGLLLGLSVDLACAIGDGFQPGPVMPVVEPGHVVDNNDGACLDAAVIAINGFAVADRGITEAHGLLLGHEEFDVITKTALIAFQGQDVIRLLVDTFKAASFVADVLLGRHDGVTTHSLAAAALRQAVARKVSRYHAHSGDRDRRTAHDCEIDFKSTN
jgi:hypothetical protein